jgi:YfiR/HmsC-like
MSKLHSFGLVAVLAAAVPRWADPYAVPPTPEASLKAAYTLNFAKFTEWPGDGGAEALQVCVVGRSLVGDALEAAARAQAPERRLRVVYVRLPGEVSGCNLMYVSDLDMSRARRLLAALAEYPILTVSDIEGFARQGGMIELVLVQRRLRFFIDLDAVRAAGLRLEPKLLRLAVQVYGEHTPRGN